MSSYQYRDSRVEDKTVSLPSYHQYGNHYTLKDRFYIETAPRASEAMELTKNLKLGLKSICISTTDPWLWWPAVWWQSVLFTEVGTKAVVCRLHFQICLPFPEGNVGALLKVCWCLFPFRLSISHRWSNEWLVATCWFNDDKDHQIINASAGLGVLNVYTATVFSYKRRSCIASQPEQKIHSM